LNIPRQRADSRSAAADFAWALAELALSLQSDTANDVDGLAIITEAAAKVIPGADGAAVVVPAAPGRLEARAVHGDLPAVLGLENEVGQGPCLEALTRTGQVRVTNVKTERRWPLFGSRAAATGALSMLCTPLSAGAVIYGCLSLVSRTAGAFDAGCASLADVLAANAVIALAGARQRSQLRAALGRRDVIGQAKGILMERYRLTPDAAFALLDRISQDTNTKLHDVAEHLTRSGGLPVAGHRRPAAGVLGRG
jgi:transcriptional regulator with GAF, ATPase, and Fis domain